MRLIFRWFLVLVFFALCRRVLFTLFQSCHPSNKAYPRKVALSSLNNSSLNKIIEGYPAVRPELDLVEQEDQFTHEISLDNKVDREITLDLQFLDNEKHYEELKKTILGEESDDEEGSDAASSDEDDADDDDEESEENDEEQMLIKDETETNLINLRRTIYLTIMSSVDCEEAGHKLLKSN